MDYKKKYEAKREEYEKSLDELTDEITKKLVSECVGKTARDLRRHTLEFITKNKLPGSIHSDVKRKVDVYIENMVVQEEKSPQVADTTSEDKDDRVNQPLSKNDLEKIGKNINSSIEVINMEGDKKTTLKMGVEFENFEEFQDLLKKAAYCAEQLKNALEEVNQFEPVIQTSRVTDKNE